MKSGYVTTNVSIEIGGENPVKHTAPKCYFYPADPTPYKIVVEFISPFTGETIREAVVYEELRNGTVVKLVLESGAYLEYDISDL